MVHSRRTTRRQTLRSPRESVARSSFNSTTTSSKRASRFLQWSAWLMWYYKSFTVLAEYSGMNQDYAINGKTTATRTRVPFSGFEVTTFYFLTGEQITRRVDVKPDRDFGFKDGHVTGPGAVELFTRYSEMSLGNDVFTAGLADPNLWSNKASRDRYRKLTGTGTASRKYISITMLFWLWTASIQWQRMPCTNTPISSAPISAILLIASELAAAASGNVDQDAVRGNSGLRRCRMNPSARGQPRSMPGGTGSPALVACRTSPETGSRGSETGLPLDRYHARDIDVLRRGELDGVFSVGDFVIEQGELPPHPQPCVVHEHRHRPVIGMVVDRPVCEDDIRSLVLEDRPKGCVMLAIDGSRPHRSAPQRVVGP